MTTLHQYAHQNPHWTLEEFVTVLNQLLPQFLPDRPDSSDSSASISSKVPHGVRDTLTPRLVRHYTSQGLVDEPQKLGRSARYGYRHLLQLLLVRRLLREGYSTQALQPLLQSKTNADLEALLQGGVQLTVTPANPALAFLESIRQRSASPPVPAPAPPPAPAAFAPPAPPISASPPPAPAAAPAPAFPALDRARPTSLPLSPSEATEDLEDLADCDFLDDAEYPEEAEECLEDPDFRTLDDFADLEIPPPASAVAYPQCSLWTRLVIMTDLELHLGPGATLPRSAQERQNLAQAIVQALETLPQSNFPT